jgi:hypothetical protein
VSPAPSGLYELVAGAPFEKMVTCLTVHPEGVDAGGRLLNPDGRLRAAGGAGGRKLERRRSLMKRKYV